MEQTYDIIGRTYTVNRRPDRRIYRQICEALGQARSVLNVGAGSGSYEPAHLATVALEPSIEMIHQRRSRRNVVQGVAESLPFADACFDATLAILTVHHWTNLEEGLKECARVARKKVLILTWDPQSRGFWLTQKYFPEILALDRNIFPTFERLRKCLGSLQIETVRIPVDCEDGFTGAYWGRPEAYLDARIRAGMSSFSRISVTSNALARLKDDVSTGAWQREYGTLLDHNSADLGYRLVTAHITK